MKNEYIFNKVQRIIEELFEIQSEIIKENNFIKENFKVIDFVKYKEEHGYNKGGDNNNKENLGSSAVQFTQKEINLMPLKYKKQFKIGKLTAHVRKTRDNIYQIYCQISNVTISAYHKNLDECKFKFINKLKDFTLTDKVTNEKNTKFLYYAKEWLDVKKRNTKERTYEDYNRIVTKDILPVFEKMNVKDITRTTIQKWINTYVDQNKFRSAEKNLLVLKCIFDLIQDEKNIKNPAINIELPYYESKRGEALSREKQQKLLDSCLNEKDTSSALLVLLFFGLRRSEIKTISWDKESLYVTSAKTRYGHKEQLRRIPFSPAFLQVKKYVDFEKAKNCNQYSIATEFKKVLPENHLHELRYTFITECKQAGINTEVVMLLDGHKSDKDNKSSAVDSRYTVFSWSYIKSEVSKLKPYLKV